jgi:hypothetical protein
MLKGFNLIIEVINPKYPMGKLILSRIKNSFKSVKNIINKDE